MKVMNRFSPSMESLNQEEANLLDLVSQTCN